MSLYVLNAPVCFPKCSIQSMPCLWLEKLSYPARTTASLLWATGLECEVLGPIPDGNVVLMGTVVDSKATYSCNPGFTLVGVETRVCQANAEWSDEEPFCKGEPSSKSIKSHLNTLIFLSPHFVSTGLICGSLPNPKNGQVTFGSTRVGTSATYQCDSGFVLVGKSTRVCQASGEWSGDEPQCQRKLIKKRLASQIQSPLLILTNYDTWKHLERRKW